MREKLLPAASEAIQEIASSMLFLEIATASAPQEGLSPMHVDLSAIVGLSGGIKGGVRLASPLAAALKLSSALVGEDLESMTSDGQDAYAELCNMIAGGIQSRLAAELGTINLSPPMVISADEQRVKGKSNESIIHQTFSVEGNQFFVEIFFLQAK